MNSCGLELKDIITIVISLINLAAIIIIPIVAVIIGQKLQDRSERRKDKMNIFRTLMTNRLYGWASFECVNALNMIDIVFAKDKKVREQWQKYYKAVNITNPSADDLNKIQVEENNLLKEIGKALGYKDKVTLQVIEHPYIPVGISNQIYQQQLNQNNYNELLQIFRRMVQGNNTVQDAENSVGKENKSADTKETGNS